jgi:O-acetyl-ADP-ribose deacetylase (regulator of RNase III)
MKMARTRTTVQGENRMPDRNLARECFVIMPFGEKPFSDGAAGVTTTMDFDAVYQDIIRVAVEEELKTEHGILIKCVRCDRIETAGPIHEKMIRHILDADVAVVDITTLNPNVFYELGVRHALRDRVTVLVRRAGTRIPFNIGGMTTIEYDLDEDRKSEARKAIASFIRNGLVSSHRDSLVYAVIPGLEVNASQGTIAGCEVYPYPLAGARGKEIWLVTGDLRHVNVNASLVNRPIDIWVSSENINMQMARVHEKSVSGLIRYLGARRDDIGDIVEDTIADELRAKMRGRQQVNPGTMVATGSGTLLDTHNVRRIYHAAAVYGTIGGGYHPVAQVEHCVTAGLALADRESVRTKEAERDPYTSILFPLLATGTGSGSLVDHAKKQLGAAITYLTSRASVTKLERVCFLVPRKHHLTACRVALAELGVAEPAATAARALAAKQPARARAAAARQSAAGRSASAPAPSARRAAARRRR